MSGRARGGWSEVWALQVTINRPRGFDLWGIWRFELVARRLAGYAVAMEVARRPEGPEVNGDLRRTVSRRSLVPSRERKRKG